MYDEVVAVLYKEAADAEDDCSSADVLFGVNTVCDSEALGFGAAGTTEEFEGFEDPVDLVNMGASPVDFLSKGSGGAISSNCCFEPGLLNTMVLVGPASSVEPIIAKNRYAVPPSKKIMLKSQKGIGSGEATIADLRIVVIPVMYKEILTSSLYV